jgi:hypothetical protein
VTITGADLIEWGHAPGKWFKDAIWHANEREIAGATLYEIKQAVAVLAPKPITTMPLRADGSTVPFSSLILGDNADEASNIADVTETMATLMRTPVVTAGAVMPDACPAGPLGTIPVGGVVASPHIHPGMHSADICCSVMVTMLGRADPRKILDAASATCHFGGGGRPRGEQSHPGYNLLDRFARNPFLAGLESDAIEHNGTSGDGNHFIFVGTVRSTGETALVTHHGSRKPGAMLYKRGMIAAQKHCRDVSPETIKANVWIDGQSEDGELYWEALQTIREWTKGNHRTTHGLILENAGVEHGDWFWNEHNFIWRRDGQYLHGKGATPAWQGFADDSNGLTLIPLNMAQPVLITRGLDNPKALGFCPHGAGRNFSRTEFARRNAAESDADIVAREAAGVDCRYHCGIPDIGELPSAYKDADAIVRQIEHFGLAEIVDYIDPYGCIMAGDWTRPMRQRRQRGDL